MSTSQETDTEAHSTTITLAINEQTKNDVDNMPTHFSTEPTNINTDVELNKLEVVVVTENC